MRLHITHISHYQYQPAVETAQHVLHIKPQNTHNQKVLNHQLSIKPAFNELTEWIDYFGNPTHYLSLTTRHDELRILSQSTVQTHAYAELNPLTFDASMLLEPSRSEQLTGGEAKGQEHNLGPWRQMQSMADGHTPLSPPITEEGLPTKIQSALSAIDSFAIQEFFTYRAAQHYHPASEFLFDSPHVHGLRPFKEYAQTSLRGKNALDGLSALMELIHHDFLYESQSTEVNTPLMEVFKQKRGVCQDFAHIMIACCRACGLPARYVSGYLLTQAPEGQARLIGSDASHAWASVFLPILGGSQGYWFDFDPTNNRFGLGSPGEDYVTLAWGRDYSDISPIRGVIQGGKDHQLQVAVTVMPEN